MIKTGNMDPSCTPCVYCGKQDGNMADEGGLIYCRECGEKPREKLASQDNVPLRSINELSKTLNT